MASGDTLFTFKPQSALQPTWAFVEFVSGSTQPALGDTITGDTSAETAILEFLSLESGTFGGGNAAGYLLLSNLSGDVADWTSGENVNTNILTLVLKPVFNFSNPDRRNNKSFLGFDAAVNEVEMFQGQMPRNYSAGGLTIEVGFMAATAIVADTSWAIFFLSVTDDADDLDTKNFAAPQRNQAVVAPSASGEVGVFTITFTNGAQMDNIAAGELFYLLIMRDAQDATNDDMVGDAQIVSLESRET